MSTSSLGDTQSIYNGPIVDVVPRIREETSEAERIETRRLTQLSTAPAQPPLQDPYLKMNKMLTAAH